jgi:hypothetical protein
MLPQRKAWELLPRSNTGSISKFRRYPYVLLAAITSILSVLFYAYHYELFHPRLKQALPPTNPAFDGQWNFKRDARNLMMNDTQCDHAFPDLFNEIDRAVESRSKHHITLKEMDAIRPIRGYNRAMIFENQV